MSKSGSLTLLHLRKDKLIIGLMSGTSADGIDAALVRVRGNGLSTSFELIASLTRPFPTGFRKQLLANSNAKTARVDSLARCDMLLGELFAKSAIGVARKGGVSIRDVDLIGSHGQTIQHLPHPVRMFGTNIRATYQIGNLSVIAKRTGVVTVGNFRPADVAAGGTGAPLVPFFDFLSLRSRKRNRAALNIGGIANITLLPKNCTIGQVSAFDTGPGNMIIDGLMDRLFHRPFDQNGSIAERGKIATSLLRWMMSQRYFRKHPPKSTGREMFGKTIIDKIVRRSGELRREDIITTVTEFTALTIYDQYVRFFRKKFPIDELIVSGGGVHNRYLMNALSRYFEGTSVFTSERVAVNPDAKEAICFALLANETISGNPSNVPGATGARAPSILGLIALP